MNFKIEIQSKYEIVAVEKKLISYDFTEGLWCKTIKAFIKVLKDAGVKADVPRTKSGHLSLGLLDDLTPDEIEKIKQYGSNHAPTFRILGVEVIGGLNTPHSYISLKVDVPQRLVEFDKFLGNLVGPTRMAQYKEMKPHVSIVTVSPKDVKKADKALPKLNEAWKKLGVSSFTPKFVEVMTNYEVQDWVEISSHCRRQASR